MNIIKKVLQGESLKYRALQGSVITFGTYGAEQGLRLLSNLILTRMLFPEAFGVMALASVFLLALNMLSDLGIHTSIIQNKRGADLTFRNTAWAVQIIRGFVLWLAACLSAYPLSVFYEEPILFEVICVMGVIPAIKGFQTTASAVENKQLKLARISLLQLGTQALGIVLMLLWAFYSPTVWALVWGNVLATLAGVFGGHIILNRGYRHCFSFDRAVLGELIRFGKWIFFASIVGFIANQADRIIVGKALSVAELGFYSLAATLAQLPYAIFDKLSKTVLLPIYSKIQDQDISSVRSKILKIRLGLIALLLPISILLIVFGDAFIGVMYDARYQDAAWMIQILAVGTAIHVATNIGPFYLGFGRSNIFLFSVTFKACSLLLCMSVGYLMYDAKGLIAGVAGSQALYYLFQVVLYRRYQLWLWKLDLPMLGVVAGAAYLSISY